MSSLSILSSPVVDAGIYIFIAVLMPLSVVGISYSFSFPPCGCLILSARKIAGAAANRNGIVGRCIGQNSELSCNDAVAAGGGNKCIAINARSCSWRATGKIAFTLADGNVPDRVKCGNHI